MKIDISIVEGYFLRGFTITGSEKYQNYQ